MKHKHHLKTFLSNLQLKDSNGAIIEKNSDSHKSFDSFIEQFCSYKYRTILYRGTKQIKDFQTEITDIPNYARKMYMLGEKSYCYESNAEKSLFCIDDLSSELFGYIFNRLKVLCENKFDPNGGTHSTVCSFLDNNPEIKNFFLAENHKKEFISQINKQSNKDKIHIKDYYISLIHTIGKSFSRNSYMISTSTDFYVAQDFKNDSVIVTWIPFKERHRQFIKFNDVNKVDSLIKKIGLPYYDISPYKNQKEICIKGGLLPHYIIGYTIEIEKSFIVNPHLLEQISSSFKIEDIIENGINIDQREFIKELNQTKYKGGFINIDGSYFDIKSKIKML